MSDEKRHIDPLPPDISEYLNTDKQTVRVPPETHHRILSRIAGSLGVTLAVTADTLISTGAAEASADGAHTATDAVSEILAESTADTVASGGGAILTTILKAKTIIAFAAGMGIGTGGYAVYDKVVDVPAPIVTPLHTTRPSPSATPDAVTETTPEIPFVTSIDTEDTQTTGTIATNRLASSSGHTPTAISTDKKGLIDAENDTPQQKQNVRTPDVQLQKERQLIDLARVALSRGNYADAQKTLQKHKWRFPNGGLEEERDALIILALNGEGRRALARQNAAAFLKKYPKSIFSRIVKKVLE